MYPVKYASKLFDKFVSERPGFLPAKWPDAILSINSSHGWRVCVTVKILVLSFTNLQIILLSIFSGYILYLYMSIFLTGNYYKYQFN